MSSEKFILFSLDGINLHQKTLDLQTQMATHHTHDSKHYELQQSKRHYELQ